MPYVYLQRRCMTLLELVISMTLTIAILTTLSYFYLQVNQMSREMDRMQNESFERRHVEHRLATILPQTVSSKSHHKDFHFFSCVDSNDLFKPGSQSLLFTFDNQVQLNKEMSGRVIGRLYLDKKRNFTLAMWPSEKRWKNENPPIRREILMENIDTLKFSFFAPPSKGKTFREQQKENVKKDMERLPDSVRENRSWETEWKPEYHQLPAIVKITLARRKGKEEQTWDFAFPLPHALHPIIYDN
ncbi:MAG: hypothetical protein WB791_03670 [Waddliaceae bacterium]